MRMWNWLWTVGVAGLVACGGPGEFPSTDVPARNDPQDISDVSQPPATPPVVTPDVGGQPTQQTPPPEVGLPRAGDYPAVQTRVPVFELNITPENLAKLDANPEADVSVPAEVLFEGQRALAQVSYRGASTRTLAQKSFDVELEAGYEFEDRDHFKLLASWYDSGKLTEKFAVDLYTALGLPVPAARYVNVRLNGKPNGLYVDMEHVGKDYLKHHGLERGASIYRCGHRNCEMTLTPGSYQTDFEKKRNEETGRADLDAFLAWINRSDDADFEAKLEQRVDVESYLGNLVGDILISNNIIEDSRSYWVHELVKDRWQYQPWDLNNAQMFAWRTWAPTDPPITNRWPQAFSLYDPWVQRNFETRVTSRPAQKPTWNVLNTRIWDRPALRARLLAKLEAALAGPFAEGRAEAHINALWGVAGPEMAKDPYASPPHVARAKDFLVTYVRARRAFLAKTVQSLRDHGGGPLVIQAVTTGKEGYVEVYNRGTTTVSLQGYELTNELRATTRAKLSGLSLAPGKVLRLVADGNVAAGPTHLPFTLSTSGGEVGLFNGNLRSTAGKSLYYAPEDALYYGPLAPGTLYGRKTLGSEDFERRPVTP